MISLVALVPLVALIPLVTLCPHGSRVDTIDPARDRANRPVLYSFQRDGPKHQEQDQARIVRTYSVAPCPESSLRHRLTNHANIARYTVSPLNALAVAGPG